MQSLELWELWPGRGQRGRGQAQGKAELTLPFLGSRALALPAQLERKTPLQHIAGICSPSPQFPPL